MANPSLTFQRAHIHDLAPETISEIFAAAVIENPQCPFNPKALPHVVSQVCSRWRFIALSTPALWSQVVLHWEDLSRLVGWELVRKSEPPEPDSAAVAEKVGSMLDLWRARIRGARVRLGMTLLAEDPFELHADFVLLGEHFTTSLLPQLQYLEFDQCGDVFLSVIAGNTSLLLPHLQGFIIDFETSDRDVFGMGFRLDAPNLHSLTLHTDSFTPYEVTPDSWSSLISLKLKLNASIARSQLLGIRYASTLQSLYLTYSFDLDEATINADHDCEDIEIAFPVLSSLEIDGWRGSGNELDRLVSMPSLRSIYVSIGCEADVHWDKLVHLLGRSGCSLGSLFLDVSECPQCSRKTLRSLLQTLPALVRLTVVHRRLEHHLQAVIDLLHRGCGQKRQSEMLLPEVTVIRFIGDSPDDITALINMVDARLDEASQSNAARITEIAFTRPVKRYRALDDELARWREGGLQVLA